MTCGAVVAVVDDDESVRESLPELLSECGFRAREFASAEAFLVSESLGNTQCLIVDFAMPGMSGLDLQRDLARRGRQIPIIFITANRDERIRQHVMEEGAVACLLKPFTDTALLEALGAALERR